MTITLEKMLEMDLESVSISDLDAKLEAAAEEAKEHIKICPDHGPHPEEILSGVEDGERADVLLFPDGKLVLRISREGNGRVVGRMSRASVQNLVKEGIEVKDVLHGLHVFIEQGKMLAMGNMPPAEA